MPIYFRGLHHYHLRKREEEAKKDSVLVKTKSVIDHLIHNGEDSNFLEKTKKILDRMIYFVGMIGPVMTLPQLKTIWIDHNASGVSAISWGTYTLTSIFWITYGFVHQEKPIIMTYIMWFIINGLVALGVILYS